MCLLLNRSSNSGLDLLLRCLRDLLLPYCIIRLGFGQLECVAITFGNRLFISGFCFSLFDMGLRLHFFHFAGNSCASITGNSLQFFITNIFFFRKFFKRILRFSLDTFANIGGNRIILVLSRYPGDSLREGLIDFLAKTGIGFGNNYFWSNHDIAVFIHSNAIRINRPGGIARYILAFFYRIELFQNFARFGRGEDTANILKQQIGHKTAPHHFPRLDGLRNGEYLIDIQLHHFPFIIFGDYREEIEQLANIVFALAAGAAPACGLPQQAVGKFIINHQGAFGREVKDIGVLLLVTLPVCFISPRILCAKCSLHILGGRLHIGKHQYRCPFGNGNAGSKLTDGEGDGFVVFFNGLPDAVKGFLIGRRRVIITTVASGQDDFIILKYRMILQQFSQRFGRSDTVKQPKGVFEFAAKFRRGKRVFFVDS